ncbi:MULTISPECIES: riboflavin biosynthesis protein RibA [unclassified Luteimonas]|uniref:riboflavin biosynthesis protein RibA n=1 Tax=unclassified Luteimonas TaxID=2629088 RepID=UPI001601306F|nr:MULTISPECIES: riboflavin biosynthesis protein RibA [unclassified Luteimonas]MBB1471743.1 riboflavin biosynthesis protein RibA [Luteimonas sp. MC1782]MBB6599514.1 riboflavin biosynthesis protein RibA [Luteimonas sp. MC1825]QOC87212.1 riboflavin biosynthesis protein RibA [Luteimonas sp. MC1825]
MSGETVLTGEVSNSKVVAVFATAGAARDAATSVQASLGLQPAQVQLLLPGEAHARRKLEPESQGIWKTIVRAHVRLGIAGAVLGVVAFAVLYFAGLQFVVRSPVASVLVLLFFGATAGLMLGGLVALRPDHDRFVQNAVTALDEGRSSVVVHAFSSEQRARAAQALEALGGDTTSTL